MDVPNQKNKVTTKIFLWITCMLSVLFYIIALILSALTNRDSNSGDAIKILYVIGGIISIISLVFSLIERKKKHGTVLILLSGLIFLIYLIPLTLALL